MEHASESLEGAPLCPNTLLHLGSRAAVDQALSRFARSGRLNRVCQGVYMRPNPPSKLARGVCWGEIWLTGGVCGQSGGSKQGG